jgi:hypothetical protein
MYALIKADMLVGRTTVKQSHGLKIDQADYSKLRFDGSALIDISVLGFAVFYVDSNGVKHIIEGENWQELECRYDDALILDDGIWRVRNVADDYIGLLSSVLNEREAAYKTESDPLYMEWQYDGTAEAEQKWRDKVAEIKERYPLPTE